MDLIESEFEMNIGFSNSRDKQRGVKKNYFGL